LTTFYRGYNYAHTAFERSDKVTYVFDSFEEVDKTLLMPWEKIDRVNQLLLLSMRHHGQFVYILAVAKLNENLKCKE